MEQRIKQQNLTTNTNNMNDAIAGTDSTSQVELTKALTGYE